MKLVILAIALAVATAAPVEDKDAQIVNSEYEPQPDGAYAFSYQSDNGISRNEKGDLKDALDEDNKPHTVVVVRGSYTYVDPEGKTQTITYTADENGYHAEGDAIPQPPAARR